MAEADRQSMQDPPIDEALLRILRCPVTHRPLERVGDELRSDAGTVYRVVDGLAVLVPGRSYSVGTGSTETL
jgi:uncharacterized protein YbaR (Trm112 family)